MTTFYTYLEPTPNQPATVHYVRVEGTRTEKLAWLVSIERFQQIHWRHCPNGWHDPFLPVGIGLYPTLPLLTDLLPWRHSGAQFKRTWPIGPTEEVVQRRWETLIRAPQSERATLFVETRDRRIGQTFDNEMPGARQVSINAAAAGDNTTIIRYGYRSFCPAWAAFDTRVGDFLRPELWHTYSPAQLFLTSLLGHPIGVGPSATVTHLIPDLHHFRGSFGGADVVPLYRDAAAREPNVGQGAFRAIAEILGTGCTAEGLFAYIYAILASPAYVERFWEELAQPGPRIPITRDPTLFHRGVDLGRRLIWLHTFARRMVPTGEVVGEIHRGVARCLAPISDEPDGYPEEFSYVPIEQEIRVGDGRFGPISQAVWNFSVSGFEIVKFWLGYHMRERAGRRSSRLDEITPARWVATLTDELLELLWTIEHTIALFPDLKYLLDQVLAGRCFTARELPQPTDDERRSPRTEADQRQDRLV